MQLPDLNKIVIIHYGCPSFDTNDDTIYWIGIIHYQNGEKTYELWEGEEVDVLKKYTKFLKQNNDKIYVHWSMNSPKFGFHVFNRKAKEMIGTHNVDPNTKIDLSEYFKTKYGNNYVNRGGGRLNNLAALNSFTGRKSRIEVLSRSEATDRLELLFSIVQAEKQNTLIVEKETILNPYPDLWNDKCYKFFMYLWQNYISNKASQANILRVMYYLKELSRCDNEYIFRCTIQQFKEHMSNVYSIKISNIDMPSNYSNQKRILENLRIQFES